MSIWRVEAVFEFHMNHMYVFLNDPLPVAIVINGSYELQNAYILVLPF